MCHARRRNVVTNHGNPRPRSQSQPAAIRDVAGMETSARLALQLIVSGERR